MFELIISEDLQLSALSDATPTSMESERLSNVSSDEFVDMRTANV